MSETKGHDPHHVDPHADQNSDEKLAQGIAEVAIGKDGEKLSTNPLEIAKILSDSKGSFIEDIQRVKQYIEDADVEPKDKEALAKRAKGMMLHKLETKKAELLATKKELEEKIAKKREALEKDPEIKEEIDKQTTGSAGIEKRDKKNAVLESELMKDDEYEELKKDLEGVKKLLKLAKETPSDAIFTVLKNKKTPAPKPHDTHDKHDDHGHDKHDTHGHDKHDDHGHDEHKGGHNTEHKEPVAAAVVEAKDMQVKHVAEFEKPEDVANAQLKWKAVVNDLGKKPKNDFDDLYFQDKDGELVAMSEEDMSEYWDFQNFMKESTQIENDFAEAIQKVSINIKGKSSEALEEEIDTKAQEVLMYFTRGITPNEIALLYFTLGVKNKARAFEKIKNVIKLQIVPNERKGKNTYEEERGENGQVQTVDLKKFLEEHQEYGDRMLANSQEVLTKLHKKFGAKIGDLAAFRDVLIEVVKSKGSKEIAGKVSADEAKAIYTNYLISLDAHAGEKEILALIISYKENPPYVFDLVNTTQGWKLDTKKTVNILEDFILDGAMYQELRGKTGLGTKEFNKFIIKVAPKYELIRSYLQGKTDKKEEVKVADMNGALHTDLTDADLKHFRKLMELPLWASKVGQAYKHAVYLNDDAGRQVPMMREGPDTVKQLDVMFVNVEEKIKRIAERLADERLDQELKEVGPQGWKQLWRIDKMAVKFWKRNAAEGYRQRYTEEFIKRLKEEPRFRTELMELPRDQVKPGYGAKLSGKTPAEGTRENISADLDAIAERFGISLSSGDTESYLTPNERTPENIASAEVQQAIKNLCQQYAAGTINDAEFQNIVRTNIIPQIQALQSPPDASIIAFLEESTGKGAVDIQKAGLLDKMRAHKAGLIALDLENMKINVRLGKAQNVDVKTQVKSLNWTDRLSRAVVETVQKNKFLGRFINPSTVAVMGYGLSNIAAQFATGQLTRLGAITLASTVFAPAIWPAVAGIAGGVAVGTLFSTLRQNKESLRLKAMKERRDALGYAPEDDQKGLRPNKAHDKRFERRLENQNALYQKVSVETLMANINNAGDYTTLQNALAQAITLNEISEMGLPAVGGAKAQPERIDLIKFSNEKNIEGERLQLVRTISQAKLRLRQLGPGRDVNTDMQQALAAQRSAVAAQMKISEANFQKVKRVENWKAAGIGAAFGAGVSALGLLVPHTDVHTNTYTLTPKGPATMADVEANLNTVGYSPTQIADIKAHMVFDPSTNKLDQASLDYFKTHQYLVKGEPSYLIVDGTHVPGTVTSSAVDLHSGTNMSQTDLLAELKAQGINTSSVAFDSKGHLTPASIAYLKGQNADITEVVTTSTGGGTNSTSTAPSGWEKLKSIHFNDNQPHAPNKHILDELHFWWKGKPQLDPVDGQVHFTAKAMLDPSKLHSKLPAGVGMPSSGTELKLGLEVKVNGVNHWKFFTPDANGDIALPPEYFDTNNLGVVAKGGDTLPGLKTHALAVGFEDQNGTYQVLASVKGNGSYTPTPSTTETVEFLGKVTKSGATEGSDTYTVLRSIEKTTEFRGVMPPLVGAPMQHLEYGKKGTAPRPNQTPANAQAPAGGPAPAPATPGSPAQAPAQVQQVLGSQAPAFGPQSPDPNALTNLPYKAEVEQFFIRNNIAKVGNAERHLAYYLSAISSFQNEQEKFAALDLCANYLNPAQIADLIKDDPAHEESANKIRAQFIFHNKARVNAMARFFDENKATFASMSEENAFREIENLFKAIIDIKDDSNMRKVLTEPDVTNPNPVPTPTPAVAPTITSTPDVAERFYKLMNITKTPEIEAQVKAYLAAPSTLSEQEKIAMLSVATQYMDPGKMNFLISDEPSIDALKTQIAAKFPSYNNAHRNVMARFYDKNDAFNGMSKDTAFQEIDNLFKAVVEIKNDATIRNAIHTPDTIPPVVSPVDNFFTTMYVNRTPEAEAIVQSYLAAPSFIPSEKEKMDWLKISIGYLDSTKFADLIKDDPTHEATKNKVAAKFSFLLINARNNIIARFYDENKTSLPPMAEEDAFVEIQNLFKTAVDIKNDPLMKAALS